MRAASVACPLLGAMLFNAILSSSPVRQRITGPQARDSAVDNSRAVAENKPRPAESAARVPPYLWCEAARIRVSPCRHGLPSGQTWQISYTPSLRTPIVTTCSPAQNRNHFPGEYVVIKTAASTLTLLLALIPLSPASVRAQTQSVFKCVDRDGHVAFQDKPCASGLREQQVAIAPAPPPAAPPDYSRPSPRDSSHKRSSKSSSRREAVYSFECHTQAGALFYRHNRCPASIDRSGLIGGRRGASREAVSARRVPRLEACRGMRSAGRDGREFDDVPSTYDRNLGRDPCRRF